MAWVWVYTLVEEVRECLCRGHATPPLAQTPLTNHPSPIDPIGPNPPTRICSQKRITGKWTTPTTRGSHSNSGGGCELVCCQNFSTTHTLTLCLRSHRVLAECETALVASANDRTAGAGLHNPAHFTVCCHLWILRFRKSILFRISTIWNPQQ